MCKLSVRISEKTALSSSNLYGKINIKIPAVLSAKSDTQKGETMNPVTVVLIYFIFINFTAFLLMGIDKSKARRGKWRIPEKTLFLSAILGGSIGAMLGMQTFRHKTKHASFRIGMPCIFIFQLVLVIFFIFR